MGQQIMPRASARRKLRPWVHRCRPESSRHAPRLSRRRGSATIDYFLLIRYRLALSGIYLCVAPRAMQLVYDLLTVMVAWPFM